ncbi:hypothetical protein [Glutamicibacter sp.]|uniref:hypothetical protein n=1 Tax=Glutamicibacter sp. TaxID=1931995 RepID=UPI0028BEFF9E|nr:hypothetical protein [Glutamicibacter sp.]
MTASRLQGYPRLIEKQPWIIPTPAAGLSGSELFEGMDASIVDFWKFAMSDLRMNNVRGDLAEFLVAKALGIEDYVRTEWDAFDIAYRDQRIEVKSSAYLQAWEQRTLSTIAFSGLRGRRYHIIHGTATTPTALVSMLTSMFSVFKPPKTMAC